MSICEHTPHPRNCSTNEYGPLSRRLYPIDNIRYPGQYPVGTGHDVRSLMPVSLGVTYQYMSLAYINRSHVCNVCSGSVRIARILGDYQSFQAILREKACQRRSSRTSPNYQTVVAYLSNTVAVDVLIPVVLLDCSICVRH
jgi:hypothetical protein